MKEETMVAMFGIGCSTLLGVVALIQRIDTALFMAVGSVIGGIVAYAYGVKRARKHGAGDVGKTSNVSGH